ncbi:unnamed protein product [Tilletia controversa]|nr:unnamed protein product [Tilletia controversa]
MGPPTPSSSSLLRLSIAYFGFLQPPTSSSLRFPVIVPTQLPVSSSGRSTHPAVRQLIRSQYPHHLFVSFSGRNTHNGSISPHRLSAAKIPLCAAPIRFPVPSLRLSAARTGSSSLYPALSGPTRLSVASTWLSAAHIRLSAASSLSQKPTPALASIRLPAAQLRRAPSALPPHTASSYIDFPYSPLRCFPRLHRFDISLIASAEMSRSRSLPSSRPSNTGGAEDAPIISSDARPVSGVTGIGRRGRELSFRFAPLSLMQLRVSQQQSVGSQAQLWSPSHSRIHLDVVKAQIARLSLTLRVRVVLHDSHVGNTIAFLITSGTCHQVHSLASLRPCGFNLTLEGVRMQAKDIVYWLHKTIGWRCNDWGFIDVDVGGQKGCTITAKLETAEDSVRAIRARIFPTSSCAVLSRTRLPSQNASSRSSS